MRSAGLDVAMNHSAGVILDHDGEPIAYRFITDKPTIHKATMELDPGTSTLKTCTKAEGCKKKSPENLWARLLNFKLWVASFMALALKLNVDAVGVENYAMGKKNNAYHIGEFGGVLRAAVMSAGFDDITLVAPRAIKTRAGVKVSEKPIEFCFDELGQDWARFERAAGLKTRDIAGDLSDAQIIALITKERHATS